tara:strand:- start:397 stop:861 length:465 start_codon:yes stop_codon:yes gene_type:complete
VAASIAKGDVLVAWWRVGARQTVTLVGYDYRRLSRLEVLASGLGCYHRWLQPTADTGRVTTAEESALHLRLAWRLLELHRTQLGARAWTDAVLATGEDKGLSHRLLAIRLDAIFLAAINWHLVPAVLEDPLDLLLALGQLVRAEHWKQPLAGKL